MPGPVTAVRRATRPSEVHLEEYPCSDGRVLMETEPHANSIVAMRNQLQWHFEARPDVYVAGSMAVYWRQGDPAAVVAPDVFVVLGVEKRSRKSYRVWGRRRGGAGLRGGGGIGVDQPPGRDGQAGDVRGHGSAGVLALRSARQADPGGSGRLAAGRFERVRKAGAAGCYRSEVLGLELRAEGWLLRFRDPMLGRDLLTHAETSRALQGAERERAEAERRAAAEAAERVSAERQRDEAERRAAAEAAERESAERQRDEPSVNVLRPSVDVTSESTHTRTRSEAAVVRLTSDRSGRSAASL